MSLDQYSEGNRTSRRLLLSITVLLALGCITGFLIDQQTDSAPGKRVRAKYRVSTGAANAVEEHVRDSSNAAADGVQLIPKVLHHVYLDGLDSLHEAEESAGPHVGQRFPGYNRTIRRSCRRAHPNWQYKFWNLSQAEELIQGSYPWFLDTFRSYETNVQKGDALRPLLMHAIGGLYLDIDVECFTSTDHLLDGREIILQLETEDAKSLNNAVMASVPGHPFWMAVIQLLLARGSQANVNHIYPWLGFLGFKDLGTVLQSTGPWAMRDAFKTFTREAGDLQLGWAGEWQIKDSRFQIYPLGQWFEPCKWDDYKCHARLQAAQHLPPELVGHHINSGAWLKDLNCYNRRLLWSWLACVTIPMTACTCCIYWLCIHLKQRQGNSSCHGV